MTNDATKEDTVAEIWDQGTYPFKHFGEIYEYTIWADGRATVAFKNANTGAVIFTRTRDWGSTQVALDWVAGVPLGRFGG